MIFHFQMIFPVAEVFQSQLRKMILWLDICHSEPMILLEMSCGKILWQSNCCCQKKCWCEKSKHVFFLETIFICIYIYLIIFVCLSQKRIIAYLTLIFQNSVSKNNQGTGQTFPEVILQPREDWPFTKATYNIYIYISILISYLLFLLFFFFS